ncbi:MAG: hypothetical protein R8J41_09460 [Alphaproteobacteria bacterium]|nr:hypothetical protein [Alphaproteobacteria bacterium]
MPLGNLTDCEKELVRCTRDGEFFHFDRWASRQEIPERGWDIAREVDGDVIASLMRGALCITGADAVRPHPRGMRAAGLALPEGLDIEHMQLIAPLRLVRCEISAVSADSVRVIGDLSLNVCTIAGAVDMIDARIDGSLMMNGTTLGDPAAPHGLRADRLVVAGSVHMNTTRIAGLVRRFEAKGTNSVRILGATVDGDFAMLGARLGGEGANSGLNADRSTVKGSVFLDSASDGTRFEAEGTDAVRLIGATIVGQFSMRGARLGGEKADGGLSADRLTVKGSVFLNGASDGTRFEAQGKDAVRLNGATIEGQLAMQGARLGMYEADSGLSADGLIVKGGAFLSSAPDGTRFEALGKDAVRLHGATIEGQLDMQGARLGMYEADSGLSADGLTVKGDVFLSSAPDGTCFEARGADAVRLVGGSIAGQLGLMRAVLKTHSGAWLNCEKLTVVEALFLASNSYDGEGGTVNFTDANIGALADNAGGWPNVGDTLLLDGLSYRRLTDCNIDYRLAWLGQQRRRQLGMERIGGQPRDLWPQPFEQCAKVLREMGHPRDARRVMVEKQKYIHRKWRLELTSPRRGGREGEWRYVPWSETVRQLRGAYHFVRQTLSWATINYGFSSLRPLAWFAGLVVVGWIIYADAGAEAGDIMVPAQSVVLVEEPYASSKQLPDGYPIFSSFFYSLDVALPLIELFQEPYWEPAGEKAADRGGWFSGTFVRWFQIGQVLSGWIFISLFVAGLANAIRRDD